MLRSSVFRWILLVAANVLILLAGCDSRPFDNRQFDQKIWLENPVTTGKGGNIIRLEMSQNLMDNHLQPGMVRQQTRKLLGKPSFSEGTYCSSRNTCDNYDLGEYVLVLTFDRAGKLIYREVISI